MILIFTTTMNLIDKLETRRDNIAKMYDNLLADVKDIIIKEIKIQ